LRLVFSMLMAGGSWNGMVVRLSHPGRAHEKLIIATGAPRIRPR